MEVKVTKARELDQEGELSENGQIGAASTWLASNQ
jgi:hypothetical protein